MPVREINFDGIVGPSHNYAGLSLGNLASTRNARRPAAPRAAALEGIGKMRANIRLGLVQGIFLPHPRPNHGWLAELGTTIADADPALAANAMSASAMWAANAATVSPAADTRDKRCHLTVANLRTMAHRSHEWPATLAQLRLAFASSAFAVHPPVPPAFGDEGAANHMRLAPAHDEPGIEIFVYGETRGPFPARQHVEACRAIAAGAFHNDVVAVANGPVLFAHEQAFADKEALVGRCEMLLPGFELVEVPASEVPLADAINSYLFNAQLVTPPDGETTLIVPGEARETPSVWSWIERHLAGNGPIRRVEVVDVRQSMANGGGPACLRLRVAANPDDIDPRFLVDEAKLDDIARVIERHWPAEIDSAQLQDEALIRDIEGGRRALLQVLDLGELA